MARGRVRESWDHTSCLLAMLANANRDRKKRARPFEPADFHPMMRARRSRGVPITPENIGLLKQVFVRGGKKR